MDPSRASFLAALVLLWTLATAALAGRLVARRLTNSQYWWDDYTAVLAFVSPVEKSLNVSFLDCCRWSCRDSSPTELWPRCIYLPNWKR